MPNKTIYVSDGDLFLFQRAQELAGGNLSAAISAALGRYVDIEEGRRDGYEEFTVRVGTGNGRKIRFSGTLLGEWVNATNNRVETFRVYRGRTGKYVLHIDRSAGWWAVDSEGKPAGIRSWLGIGNYSYGSTPAESTLEVIESIEGLRDKIPPELYDVVARSSAQPLVEELDI